MHSNETIGWSGVKLLGFKAMAISSFEQAQELQEMVRCVQMFFGQQRAQREIATELGIQQSRVSRLLKKAKDEGLYKVEFNFPVLAESGARLIERYGLRDAIVIPQGDPEFLKEELGRAAAKYFERIATDGVRVGLSCGNTLFYFVKHLMDGKPRSFQIYPLGAETNLRLVDISFNTLVGMMTAKYRPGSVGYALPAQLAGSADNDRQTFLKSSDVRPIFEQANNVDIAVVGIGGLDQSGPGFCELAGRHAISAKRLKKLGVVGEFNYQPFDQNGSPIESEELKPALDKVIGVSLKRFSELSTSHGNIVIAVAGGPAKAKPVRAALAGGLFNVLITDHETAESLLSA